MADFKKTNVDMVNRPPHYNREGGMESIDEMILVFGKEAVKNFCLCNVWKYRYRAADKNGQEDLKKSDWYMRKYKELCDDKISLSTITWPSAPITTPATTQPITYDTQYKNGQF
jgi:hypothetical protein